MTKKTLYSAPEADLLEIRFEECILSPTGESFDSQTGSDDDSDWD